MGNIVRVGHDAEGGVGAIAYFHLPSEIAPELRAAGFGVEEIFGVEGPAGLYPISTTGGRNGKGAR